MKKGFIEFPSTNGLKVIVDPNAIIAFSHRGDSTTLHLSSGQEVKVVGQADDIISLINQVAGSNQSVSTIQITRRE